VASYIAACATVNTTQWLHLLIEYSWIKLSTHNGH